MSDHDTAALITAIGAVLVAAIGFAAQRRATDRKSDPAVIAAVVDALTADHRNEIARKDARIRELEAALEATR